MNLEALRRTLNDEPYVGVPGVQSSGSVSIYIYTIYIYIYILAARAISSTFLSKIQKDASVTPAMSACHPNPMEEAYRSRDSFTVLSEGAFNYRFFLYFLCIDQ